MNKATTLTLVMLVLIMLVTLTPQTTHTATHMQPPQPQKLWESPDLGDYVRSIAWSPDGSKVAAGGDFRKVIVFSSSGKLLWESPDLGGRVYSIAWSPDGSKVAIGTGNLGGVIVFSSSGQKLWENSNLSGWVYSVAWSPDGTKLAVGAYSEVLVFSPTGEKLWESPNLNGYVYSIAWSPDGSKLAAGTGNGSVITFSSSGRVLWVSPNLGSWVYSVAWSPDGTKLAVGAYSKVLVFSSLGTTLWGDSNLSGWVYSLAWSPDGTKLAAGGSFSKVIVFSSSGSKLWESGNLGGWIWSVAWSPDSSKVAAGTGTSHKVFVFSSSGKLLWKSPDLGDHILSVAWSPDGTKLAAGGISRRVFVFFWPVYGVVRVFGVSFGCGVCFFDGSVTNCYALNSSGLEVYADPGSYEVRYYLTDLPQGYVFIGNVSNYFRNNPITKTLSVDAGGSYTLKPPTLSDFLSRLGKLVIRGLSSVDLRVRVSWGSGSKVLNVSAGGSVEAYAAPGSYEVRVLSGGFVGSLGSGSYVVNVSAGGVRVVDLAGIVNASVVRLVLRNPLSVGVDAVVKWGSGSKEFSLAPGGEVSTYAVAGNYVVEFRLVRYPSDLLGNPSSIGPVTKHVSINGEGTYEIVAPSLDEFLGTLELKASPTINLIANISWASGSRLISLPAGKSPLKTYATPGEYRVSYYLTDLPQGYVFVGDVVDYFKGNPVVKSLDVKAGETYSVSPPALSDFLSKLGKVIIKGLSSTDLQVRVSWGFRSKVLNIPAGGYAEVYATPGGYEVRYYLAGLPSGYGFVGDVSDYLSNNPIVKSLNVGGGGEYVLDPPSMSEFLGRLGKLVVYGPAGSIVKVTWGSSGSASYTIPASGVLELYAVPGTAYLIYASSPGGGPFVKAGNAYISKEGEVKEVNVTNALVTTSTTATATTTTPTTTTQTPASITTSGSTATRSSASTTTTVTSGSSPSAVSSGFSPLILAAGVGGAAGVVGVVALLASRRRKGVTSREVVGGGYDVGGAPAPSGGRPKASGGGSAVGAGPAVSFGVIESVLGEALGGLVGGYGCVEGYSPREVVLRSGIAPEGFEGSWECCLLGCGGWGCAYLCRQEGREAVFKVPRGFEGVFDGGFVPTVHARLLERIRDEARVLRGLKHPNILRLLGVGRFAPVLAYEFAEGGSLEWQLSRGWSPSLRDVLLVGIQVGDALRYIHSRGLIHGDIKPGNVFVKGGVAKVGDFSSMVKLVTMSSRLSRMSYTPGFRAPEQVFADLRRKVRELGLESRIDTYLLGNLLLYLLTGRSVDGEDAVGSDEVNRAVEAIEDPELREVVREALNPDPLQRPSTEEIVKKLLKIWASRYRKR